LNELRATQSPRTQGSSIQAIPNQPSSVTPQTASVISPQTNTPVNTVIVSDTNNWVPYFFVVLGLIAVVLIIIAYKMYCAPKTKEKEQEKGDERFPPDVQKYLLNQNGKVMAWLKPEKFFIPLCVADSRTIPTDKIEPHVAISWTRLSAILDTGRKRVGSELKRKSTWNMKHANGLYESTPSMPIQWYGAFSSGEDVSTLFKEADTYAMSHVATSSEDPDFHVIKLESSWKNYFLVIHQSCVENIIVLSNAPDIHTFTHFSWKSYEEFPAHSLHQSIEKARMHQDEYNKTDMNQEATPQLKTIIDNYKNATSLLNNITLIKKGMNDTKNRLKI
jgi:hypothetical protein